MRKANGQRRTEFHLMRLTGQTLAEIRAWPFEEYNSFVDEMSEYQEELNKAFSVK
ncbi:MAG: hypothetical protein WCD76_04290 [Pyrinomonadaceae bacterium]